MGCADLNQSSGCNASSPPTFNLAPAVFGAPNQASYMVLDQGISPVTFSVGNTMKRVAVVVSSVMFFKWVQTQAPDGEPRALPGIRDAWRTRDSGCWVLSTALTPGCLPPNRHATRPCNHPGTRCRS